MSIQPLSPEVIAQIKSSATITSLNAVVLELFKNSLDACATKVEIIVDYSRGGCVVEDNGLGIQPAEFTQSGGLGKPYHSSKLHGTVPVYGTHGLFLASVAALSLLSITSCHHLHYSQNSLVIHNSTVLNRQTPAESHQQLSPINHGTRAVVRDLFGSMPVRVKQRPVVADTPGDKASLWETLKRGIVAILLAWPKDVLVTIREANTRQKLVFKPASASTRTSSINITRICSILSQASYIESSDRTWVRLGASTSVVSIKGVISLTPVPTKRVQFVTFGILPLSQTEGHNIIYDEINRLFINSAFGVDDKLRELDKVEMNRRTQDGRFKTEGYTELELRSGKKGIDRWPMFYINIDLKGHVSDSANDVDDILDNRLNSLGSVLDLLEGMLFEFLSRHQFQPKLFLSSGAKAVLRHCESNGTMHPSNTAKSSSLATPASSRSGSAPTKISRASKKQSSSTIESPFMGWSRVKSGGGISKVAKSRSDPSTTLHMEQDEIGQQGGSKTRGKSSSENTEASTKTVVSKSGMVTRRPFEDVHAVSRIDDPRKKPDTPLDISERTQTDQELTTWTNPVTKVTSVINLRTGRVLLQPNENSKALGRLTRKSSDLSMQKYQSPWIQELLDKWDNPIYKPGQGIIPQVHLDGIHSDIENGVHGTKHQCSHFDIEKALTENSAEFSGRMSKDALRNAEVISQVDKKFILVKLGSKDTNRHRDLNSLLVIVDQHAADERVRIESLMEALCTPSDNPKSRISTTFLEKPICFDLATREINLLSTYQTHFANWGILFDLPQLEKNTSQIVQKLVVHTLPPPIAERCRLDPKALITLLRTEAWHLASNQARIAKPLTTNLNTQHPWLQQITTCPKGLIEMLNSRACRSAIMFNDELPLNQCEVLLSDLAKCAFPFQCAHGRPSIVPLMELRMFGSNSGGDVGVEEESFGKAYQRWVKDG